MSSTIAAPSTADLAEWAAHYARSGFEVFPLNADKSPATAHGFLDATSDVETVAGWWAAMPTALIGCRIPEGVVVLDVDPRHGGVETMKEHVDRHGRLPRGRQHFSGRGDGGGHRWFTRPAGKLTTKHLPGVDLLHHDLRYSILPPSPHPETGKPYEWSADGGPETAPAEMPGWLSDLIVDDRPEVEPKPALERLPGDNLHRASGESPIERFKAEHTIEELLARHGWVEVRAGAWCHPTATSKQSATVTDGRLYNYSDNSGLPVTEHGGPQGMDVFDLFRYLEHGGDLDAAIRAAGRSHDYGTGLGTSVRDHTIDEPQPAVSTRLKAGARFVLDDPAQLDPIWGAGDEILWASGEPLLIAAPPGVGKTTLAQQVVRAQLGISSEVIGYPVKTSERRVLYLAMDRPRQIRRSMRRIFSEADRPTLDERLIVWEGPLPADLGRSPEILAELAAKTGAGVVWIDSLKDAAVKLTDDEVGGTVNRAIQTAIAEGIEVAVTHHQRKGQGGAKPNTLEDVYGSTWLTAGAGSVILLWGAAGDALVELIHLKQPASPVGPLTIEHDHDAGISRVERGFNALAFLRGRSNGATVLETAQAQFEKTKPTKNELQRSRRALNRLVTAGLAALADGTRSGEGGRDWGRYYAVETRLPRITS